MDERKAPRPQDPNDLFAFHDNQIPQLKGGTYTFSVTSTLDVDGHSIDGTRAMQFRVGGPQLVLPPGEVVAQFPANHARGAYDTVLPHVTLARASLPWERSAGGSSAQASWLLLLIVTEAQLAQHVTRDVWNVARQSAALTAAGIPHEDADPEAHVHVATLNAPLVSDLFPEPADLDWLAHVRDVIPAGTSPHVPSSETATVISPILPTAGAQNHALLVSMENRYTTVQKNGQKTAQKPVGALTVPVLHEWSFYCQPADEHTLTELLKQAMGPSGVPVPLVLPSDPATPGDLAARYAQGFVPVEHHMRRGDLSAAWLRSPLAPGAPLAPTPAQVAHLPARHSDGLLSLDADFGLLDVSYAAAWELGRLLMLAQSDIAEALYHWKRSHAQTLHINTTRNAGDPLPEMPGNVADWIKSELLELRSVPFAHLVPDPAMLPPGAFRFFDIDPFWLDCLRDGALAVGRTDSAQHKREMGMRAALPEPAEMSGFLLRSAAVTDFPHLEVDGYDTDVPNAQHAPVGKTPLDILRFERLSRDVLMVIFAGKVATADLHLHPQAVHFGLDEDSQARGYEKHIHNVNGIKPVPVQHTGQRVHIDDLAGQLVGNLSGPSGPVSKFALQMIEKVELVRFRRAV